MRPPRATRTLLAGHGGPNTDPEVPCSLLYGFGAVIYQILIGPTSTGTPVWLLWFSVIFCGGWLISDRFVRSWTGKVLAPTGRKRLKGDARKPILYLRPFESEAAHLGIERQVARCLRSLGPVVAIGKPEDRYPPSPSIARDYPLDWQRRVLELVASARVVVALTGTSDGLIWEYQQLIRRLAPQKLIVCLAGGTRDYDRFRMCIGHLFPKTLPADIRRSVFLVFAPDWTPIRSTDLEQGVVHPPAPLDLWISIRLRLGQ